MKRLSILAMALVALSVAACGKNKEKEAVVSNAPAIQNVATQVRNLGELMNFHASGVVKPQPWAGYWWPYVGAGIASTFRDPNGQSPADKYDEAYLNYLKSRGFDTTKFESAAYWERGRHGPGLANVASWWGHCNGWSAASLMVPEPREAKTVFGVTFQVRDLKAVLAESWMEFSGDFVGNRVNDKGDFSSAAFWDVVPAQFHLMLTNIVGKQGRGVILDRHTGDEIWNQPVLGYKIDPIKPEDYLGAHPQYPEIYRVNVTTKVWWAQDNVGPDEVTPEFNMDKLDAANEYWDYFFPGRKLMYELWLDGPVEFDETGKITKSGNILVTREDGRYVGGVWKNASAPAALIHSHPDYMWVPFGVQHSTGYKNPRIDDAWVRENIGMPRNL